MNMDLQHAHQGRSVVHAIAEKYQDRRGKKRTHMGEMWCGRRMDLMANNTKTNAKVTCKTCKKALKAQGR